MEKEKAVVLLSGGMDSAVCLAIAVKEGYEPCALHLNYGQRTQSAELNAFNNLCEHYSVQNKLIVDVSHFTAIGGSSLTDMNMDVPMGGEHNENQSAPNSYVPFRNANILAIAVSWAEVINAKALYIGAAQVDYSGYPDCRSEFFEAFQQTINTGCKPETRIEIKTPIINFSKAQIVQKGVELNAPFQYTWSCYKNEGKACGVCDSCLLRLKGFKEAGATDPIEYENIK
jgi:7-cyano-7-deazaguanine synthase